MVDVEHGALRAFKENGLAVSQRLVQQRGGVAHEGSEFCRSLRVFLVHLVGIERLELNNACAIIFFRGMCFRCASAVASGQAEVRDPQACGGPSCLRGRPDAAGRGATSTTTRGIGPTYEDKMGRRGLRVADLLDLKLLRTHIENACREKNMIAHALFNSEPLDPDKMYQEYAEASAKVAPFVCDTAALLNQALADGESVLFEGAQGTMLDIDHGTYPFVTSSSATSGGAVIGTGVAPTRFTRDGVSKAYSTRVGGGPFPSEAAGRQRRPAAGAGQ